MINSSLWRFRAGAPWRNVSERDGPRTAFYNRFARWRAAGICDRRLEAVSAAYDGEIVMIDCSCVRVHQHGTAIKKGQAAIARCENEAVEPLIEHFRLTARLVRTALRRNGM